MILYPCAVSSMMNFYLMRLLLDDVFVSEIFEWIGGHRFVFLTFDPFLIVMGDGVASEQSATQRHTIETFNTNF